MPDPYLRRPWLTPFWRAWLKRGAVLSSALTVIYLFTGTNPVEALLLGIVTGAVGNVLWSFVA